MMARTSTAEHHATLAGALSVLEALPGPACLIGQDGVVLGGNAAFRDTAGKMTPGQSVDPGMGFLGDVLGTSQVRMGTLCLGGVKHAMQCRRFELDGQPCILAQEDRRKQAVAQVVASHRGLLKTAEELDRLRAEERKQREEAQHWRQMSMTDRMTGLLNSVGFRDRAAAALQTAGVSVLVYADLNGFKQINDSLGHAAGDQLLRDVAQTLTMATRSSDVLGRVGGDEFAVLLVDCGEADRRAVMSRLSASMARRFPVDQGVGQPAHILQVSASMGHACYPEDAGDLETLMRKADARMYVNKRAHQALRKEA